MPGLEPLKERLRAHGVAFSVSTTGPATLTCLDLDGNTLSFVETLSRPQPQQPQSQPLPTQSTAQQPAAEAQPQPQPEELHWRSMLVRLLSRLVDLCRCSWWTTAASV